MKYEIWTIQEGLPEFKGYQRATNFVEACAMKFGEDLLQTDESGAPVMEDGCPTLIGIGRTFRSLEEAKSAIPETTTNYDKTMEEQLRKGLGDQPGAHAGMYMPSGAVKISTDPNQQDPAIQPMVEDETTVTSDTTAEGDESVIKADGVVYEDPKEVYDGPKVVADTDEPKKAMDAEKDTAAAIEEPVTTDQTTAKKPSTRKKASTKKKTDPQ